MDLAIQQSMAFEFAEIVAELVEPVGLRRKLEGGQDGGVNLFGSPTADGIAAVQENLSSRMIRASWILIPG